MYVPSAIVFGHGSNSVNTLDPLQSTEFRPYAVELQYELLPEHDNDPQPITNQPSKDARWACGASADEPV